MTDVPPPTTAPAVQADLHAAFAASVDRVRAISATVAAFEDAGCAVADQLLACVVTIPLEPSERMPHRTLLEAVADVADVHLRFEHGPAAFELSGTHSTPLDFLGEAAGEPDAAFDPADVERARRAWQGNVEAALSLPGHWSGNVMVNLAAPLRVHDGTRTWRAVRSTGVVVQTLAAYPWWRTGEIIHDEGRPTVVAVVDEEGVNFQTPSFAVISLDRLSGTGPFPRGTADRRVRVQSSGAAQVPHDLPLPEELDPLPGHVGGDALADELRSRSEACAWAWLSTAMRIEPAGEITLEYFGYRRRTFHLTAGGYVAADEQRALRMYEWATAEISPDRVLAIRQVVSLHEGDDLPAHPEDIVRAAEPLYQALRAGEVAAVLETQRQARSIAVYSARESAAAAQAAAKSAAERTIASLAAVAGIAVAHATAVLPVASARGLALGIAALFAFLALWDFAVEGPAMKAPIHSFERDLPTIGQLLPAADRAAILEMRALTTASHAVLRVRIAAPLVYVAGALITILIAHHHFGLRI